VSIAAKNTASGLPWHMRLRDDNVALAIAQQYDIPEIAARILAGRNVARDSVPDILNPTLRALLPDPYHLRDMDKAVARIMAAIASRETIAVFGDYDVDGATSAAQLVRYFAALGIAILTYIPDRMREGYGPNINAFDALIAKGATLIITVDCGTLAHREIAHAAAKHCDVVVIDHHIGEPQLPEAVAVVNPNRADETSPHTNLCAAGVVFLLLVALNAALREQGFFQESVMRGQQEGGMKVGEPDLLSMLDMVALGTVCDVMTLTGLNRAYVKQGLKVLAQRQNVGLQSLSNIARMEETPGVYHLGFLLGPRINAGGRVGQSPLGLQLLTSDDMGETQAIATQLDQYNRERQAIESSVLEQAMLQAEAQQNMPVMLLASPGWHAGVIGIVAGRIKEAFARPAAVVSLEAGVGKGSARSVAGADMGAAIHRAQHAGIITAGGGHAMAAGFTVPEANIAALHEFLCDQMEAAVTAYGESRARLLDGWLRVASITPEWLHAISELGPYGMGFPAPRFALKQVRIVHKQVLKDAHIKLVLMDEGGTTRLNAIAFGATHKPLGEWLLSKPQLNLMGEVKWNRWQGNATPQLIVEDAAID
jgi:single-stranded-DNA-specific exonuclease